MKIKTMIKSSLTLFFLCLSVILSAQSGESINQKLGYEDDKILLILHADDLGVAHSVNQASFKALSEGSISSASIMIPCPWLLEVADYAKENPEADLGLHLTLTAEWEQYKWKGVSSSGEIKSLINSNGYFYDNTSDVSTKGKPEEARKEIQAQIDQAKKVGINPTHLDSHMGALFTNPSLFRVYVETGIKNKIPVFVPQQAMALFTDEYSAPEEVIPIQFLAMMNPGIEFTGWQKYYQDVLKGLKPGLNEIIVHLGYDNSELQGVAVNHPDYGSKWREMDLEVVESSQFKALLEELDIQLVTYREIQEAVFGDQ